MEHRTTDLGVLRPRPPPFCRSQQMLDRLRILPYGKTSSHNPVPISECFIASDSSSEESKPPFYSLGPSYRGFMVKGTPTPLLYWIFSVKRLKQVSRKHGEKLLKIYWERENRKKKTRRIMDIETHS